MPKDYDITTIKNAIEGTGGIMQHIAQKLGCEWHTAKTYIEKYPETKLAYDNECESVIDLAESKLIENIEDNDNTAIIFFLKTKGRHRGYIERIENINKNYNQDYDQMNEDELSNELEKLEQGTEDQSP